MTCKEYKWPIRITRVHSEFEHVDSVLQRKRRGKRQMIFTQLWTEI